MSPFWKAPLTKKDTEVREGAVRSNPFGPSVVRSGRGPATTPPEDGHPADRLKGRSGPLGSRWALAPGLGPLLRLLSHDLMDQRRKAGGKAEAGWAG